MQTPQMKIRDFHILSDGHTGCQPIDATCQFIYRNFLISVSTAGLSKGACQTHVCIFDGEDFQDVFEDGFNTVELAIEFINHYIYMRSIQPKVLKQLHSNINNCQ